MANKLRRGAAPHNRCDLDWVSRIRDNRAMPKPRERFTASDLVTFAAVARAGGIRRAAEALGVPRSTVSRQLAALERALGGRLVTRSTRRFVLTELGAALAEQCARLDDVIAAVERVAARSANEPTGTLRLAASPIIGEELLPGVVADYLARFPKVRVEVQLEVGFVDLRRSTIDVAVRTGPLQDASDLFASRLGTSLKGHYASRAYLKARGTPVTPIELAQHDCIVVGARRDAKWSFRGRSGEVIVDAPDRLATDSYALARAACIAGAGIARLPSLYAAPHVERGALVPVLERFWQRTVLFAVHAAGQPAPPKIRAFVDLVRDAMARRLER
jgi:DNA-binding transcriptional LysR family regulator